MRFFSLTFFYIAYILQEIEWGEVLYDMISLSQLKSATRLFVKNPHYLFRVAYERLRPHIYYYFYRRGTSGYPSTITLFLTYQCNMRCKMCGLWRYHAVATPMPREDNRLKPAEYAELIRQVAFFRPTIMLFGGEPLVYEDWATVAEYAKKAHLRCRMVTNGFLLERNAQKIVELGVDKVNVSIDGPAPIHDEVRGVKGAFDRAIRGIRTVDALKRIRKSHLPLISVVCTISSLNHAYLLDLAEAMRGEPIVSLVFQHLTFLDMETYEEHNRLFRRVFGTTSECCRGFVMSHENLDPQVLIAQLHRLSHTSCPFPILFRPDFSFREVVEYYTNPNYIRASHQRCVAPWREVYVMPDGTVTPCLDYIVGNIRETPFIDLWNNERFCRFRKVIKKHGRFPFCHKCCN